MCEEGKYGRRNNLTDEEMLFCFYPTFSSSSAKCSLFVSLPSSDPNSGSSRDWARLSGIPFSYTFELRDKGELDLGNTNYSSVKHNMLAFHYNLVSLNDPPGEFSHLLPEEQIQPACEEAYAGVLSIITYVHDKAFNNSTLPNAAVITVSGVAMTIWSMMMAVFLTTAVF